jgi:hypothetical protein
MFLFTAAQDQWAMFIAFSLPRIGGGQTSGMGIRKGSTATPIYFQLLLLFRDK